MVSAVATEDLQRSQKEMRLRPPELTSEPRTPNQTLYNPRYTIIIFITILN